MAAFCKLSVQVGLLKQANAGNASGAGDDTLRRVGGRDAPQRKHRDALGRDTGLAEPFEALG